MAAQQASPQQAGPVQPSLTAAEKSELVLPPVQLLQTRPDTREAWIAYQAGQAACLWHLHQNLETRLRDTPWRHDELLGPAGPEYGNQRGGPSFSRPAPGGGLGRRGPAGPPNGYAGRGASPNGRGGPSRDAGYGQQPRGQRYYQAAAPRPESMLDCYKSLIAPLTSTIIGMEARGLAVDEKALTDLEGRLKGMLAQEQAQQAAAQAEAYDLHHGLWHGETLEHGGHFEPPVPTDAASPAVQVAGTPAHTTKHKHPHTKVERINAVLRDFVAPLQRSIEEKRTGAQATSPLVIHPSFNNITASGWLYMSRPTAIDTDMLAQAEAAKVFVPRPGHMFIQAVYHGLPLAVLAHLSKDAALQQALRQAAGAQDPMRALAEITAASMATSARPKSSPGFGQAGRGVGARARPGAVPPQRAPQVTPEQIKRAADLDAGLPLGRTAASFAAAWGVPVQVAEADIAAWHGARAGVHEYQRKTVGSAAKYGRVYTLAGRYRLLPELVRTSAKFSALTPARVASLERTAMIAPVVGSAADVLGAALVRLDSDRTLNSINCKPVGLALGATGILLEVPANNAKAAVPAIQAAMSHPFGAPAGSPQLHLISSTVTQQ